ncbi:MatE-like protein [Fragilaria crotonensis]|nr:MatE-like protein [Fragilaria crotonensis]
MDAQNGDSGNKSSATSAPTVLSTERSSDRIVGPFGIEPAHVFLIAAVPLCLGAYSGFQKQVKEAEKEAKELAHRKAVEALGKRPPPLKFTVDGRMLAARAFGIGTMLSLGSFAAVEHEAFDSSRVWGRKRRADIEGWSGMDFSKDDPDKIATKGMSEDEEMDYIQRKYLSDEIMKKDSNSILTNWIQRLGWRES